MSPCRWLSRHSGLPSPQLPVGSLQFRAAQVVSIWRMEVEAESTPTSSRKLTWIPC